MKQTELRIGNLVYKRFENDEDEITSVGIRDMWDIQANSTGKFTYNPIPLSPEILIKAGFGMAGIIEIGKDQYLCGDTKGIYLQFESNELLVSEVLLMPHIQHVHQLQNLYFALTGKELDITL